MKKKVTCLIAAVGCAFLCSNIFSCNNNNPIHPAVKELDAAKTKNNAPYSKPPSTYQDTFKISVAAAVFFYPDSLQMERIKQHADKKALQGSMHEYFYLMRNSKMILKKTWPKLKVIDAANCRYLSFIRKGASVLYIDLDKVGDPYGLFVFDGNKLPQIIDMSNIESEASFYFMK